MAALTACVLSALLLVGISVPAYASCGDTTAEWVDPTLGSTWSGTMDDTTSFTLVLVPELLGVRAAATVVSGLTGTGAGTWVHDFDTRWTATVAGVWSFRFEVGAVDCSGGDVTAAAGAATDALFTVHYLTMSRTL